MAKLKFAFLCAAAWMSSGFVLEGNMHWNINPEHPDIEFHLTSSLPTLTEKEKFEDGAYATLDNDAFWVAMLGVVMNKWNEIEGSYVNLTLSTDRTAVYDSKDLRNSIVATDDLVVTVAADANPSSVDNMISDCDLRVRASSQVASELANTLLHELGHCLGIGHNHFDTKSIMSYNRTRTKLQLGLQDISALIYLYPEPKYASKRNDFAPCGVVAASKNSKPVNLIFVLATLMTPLAFMRRKSKATN